MLGPGSIPKVESQTLKVYRLLMEHSSHKVPMQSFCEQEIGRVTFSRYILFSRLLVLPGS